MAIFTIFFSTSSSLCCLFSLGEFRSAVITKSYETRSQKKRTQAPVILGSEPLRMLRDVLKFILPIPYVIQTASTSALVTWHCGIEAGERPV